MMFYKIYGQNEYNTMVLIDTIYTEDEYYADIVVEKYKKDFTDSWTIWHEKAKDEKKVNTGILVEKEMIL